jgi:hypothetical protein
MMNDHIRTGTSAGQRKDSPHTARGTSDQDGLSLERLLIHL